MFSRAHCLQSLACLIILLLSSCSFHPTSESYNDYYAHLDVAQGPSQTVTDSDHYIVFLVDARHFDYTNTKTLFKTMVKNPIDGSKRGNVGHAWLYLYGIEEGQEVVMEGGHSGEFGYVQPKYFDGVMNLVQYGYLSPTPEEKKNPRHEPNPIKYLWAAQRDGILQKGSGQHTPTYAAKVDLTEEQYEEIKAFIHPSNYNYRDFSVTDNQCAGLLARVAALIDLELECHVTMEVEQTITMYGHNVQLWEDEQYSSITFSAPDALEKSLMKAVAEGKAEAAKDWYIAQHPECRPSKVKEALETVYLFPVRFTRYLMFQ